MTDSLPFSFAAVCLDRPVSLARLRQSLLDTCPVAVGWCRRGGSTVDVPALARLVAGSLPALLNVTLQEAIGRRWFQRQPQPVSDVPARFDLVLCPVVECLEHGSVTLRLAVMARLVLRTVDPDHRIGINPSSDRLVLPPAATWTAAASLSVHDHAHARMPHPEELAVRHGSVFHEPGSVKLRLPFDHVRLT
jgi:hypothetical protein